MPHRPNLLFLHSDQHSARVLGCAGDPLGVTPHLDALAATGVVCDAVYCPSPLCVPSRMAALTGRHPHEIEVWDNDHILDSSVPTIAHAWGAAGYRPVLIGRMHARGPDQLHGYVERLVGDHGPNHPGGPPVDHGEFHGTMGPRRISLRRSGCGQSAYQVHDEDVAGEAVAFLHRVGRARRAGTDREPFCLTVGFMLPHQPFLAREEDYARFRGRVPPPRQPAPPPDEHPHLRAWREHTGILDVTEDESRRARTAYWALVHRLDALIGDILAALDANGLRDDTLIVYTSDHGEQAGERGLWWKQTFYDDSVRVPCLVSWPGVIPAGRRLARVASTLDLTATLVAAAGGPPLPGGRGRSLLPLLRGDAGAGEAWEDLALSEFCTPDGARRRMVRAGPWKLIHHDGMSPQLFHLAEDPEERRDRAADPACAIVVSDLTARVFADGWDPRRIDRRFARRQAELSVLEAWAQHARPAETHRWPLAASMHRWEEARS